VLLEELLELLLRDVAVAPAITSLSVHIATLPVDSQPKAVDKRMPSRTPGFWTVWICRQIHCCCQQIHTEPANLSSICSHLSTAPSWLSTAIALPWISALFHIPGSLDDTCRQPAFTCRQVSAVLKGRTSGYVCGETNHGGILFFYNVNQEPCNTY
ncbi:hypothetical protein Taro_022725, partial [Colocasia esculenta]|nr:hypothetical protein [Colocasia esculenta]